MSETNGLPDTWVETKLAQVVEVHDNLRKPVNAKERAHRDGPYPYYGATGQVGWIDDFRQDGEYVLLGEDGAPFLDATKTKAYMVSGKCWVNNHAHVLKGVANACENRYLMHALNQTNYRGFANGTTRLKLTQAAMKRLPFPLAPLNEQRRVVAKIEELFSDLDAGVAALERAQANLKRYRASVLKAAVEGRLTAQWREQNPDVEPASELLERILTERRERWEADERAKYEAKGKKPPKGWKDKYKPPAEPDVSKLPELPDGWCWATVDAVSDVVSGNAFKSQDFSDDGVPVLKIANVGYGIFLEKQQEYLPEVFLESHPDYRVAPETLLLALTRPITGNTLKVCIYPSDAREALLNQRVAMLCPSTGIEQRFLFNAMKSDSFRREIQERMSETLQPNLSPNDLKDIPIAIPPSTEQAEIVAAVEQRLSVVDSIDSSISASQSRSSRLRQAILKRAFEGKLVPQDPSDEPAGELLARIVVDRSQSNQPLRRAKKTTKRKVQVSE